MWFNASLNVLVLEPLGRGSCASQCHPACDQPRAIWYEQQSYPCLVTACAGPGSKWERLSDEPRQLPSVPVLGQLSKRPRVLSDLRILEAAHKAHELREPQVVCMLTQSHQSGESNVPQIGADSVLFSVLSLWQFTKISALTKASSHLGPHTSARASGGCPLWKMSPKAHKWRPVDCC